MIHPVKIELGKFKYLKANGKYHHVHGHLNFEIGGRSVPMMGYWGPDDVCFNTWIEQFALIRKAIQTRQASHMFDECEQGQPAYLFKVLPQSIISLSIVDSELGDGKRIKSWQNIQFSYSDFKAELLKFKQDFLVKIEELAPDYVNYWENEFESPKT